MSDPRVAAGSILAGKYVVERVIGVGGMAEVVAATHRQLGERVAIKVLHRHVVRRTGSISRFLNEARVAMRLRSEHVARVHDIGTLDDGTPFMVMELLEGADLATVLQTRGALPLQEACDYVLQACEAMAEAHGAGVVHRDLKPENLFLTARVDGSKCVKVLDFGVSKVREGHSVMDEPLYRTAPPSARFPTAELARSSRSSSEPAPEDASATRTNAMLGSPRYMAPEQIRAARDVDARADVWALGVILHELITGHAPFDGETLERLCARIMHGEPELRTTAPVATILGRCFEKDRERRYDDVASLARALGPFASVEGRRGIARIGRIARIQSGRHALQLDGTLSSTETSVTDPAERSPRTAWVAGTAVALAIVASGLAYVQAAARTRDDARSAATSAPSVTRAIVATPAAVVSAPPSPLLREAEPRGRFGASAGDGPARPPPSLPRTRRPSPSPTASTVTSAPPPAGAPAPSADPLGLDKGFLFDERK